MSNIKQASKFYTAWVAVKAAYFTVWYSCRIMWTGLTGKHVRPKMDQHIRNWAQRLINPTKMDYQVHNPHNTQFVSDRPIIVVSNHLSAYDIPLSLLAIPASLRMLAKKELFRIPIMAQGMRAAEFIKIDRQNRKEAKEDLKNAKRKLESGIVAWIAPEGTRSKTTEMLPFKKGAFTLAIETQAIIIPAVLIGIEKVLPTKTLQLTTGVHVDLHIGEPIDTQGLEKKDIHDLIKTTREQMLAIQSKHLVPDL
jgi:1-acyl-sn-glycerol-3-phosphate acyltransferase